MSLFVLAIEKALIYDAREFFNSAEVSFHSFVSHEFLSIPEAQLILDAQTYQERRDAVVSAAGSVAQLWETLPIENIPDRHTFEFGDTGRHLYRNTNTVPAFLDWFMLVIENDSDVRNIAEKVGDFFTDSQIDKVGNSIATLADATGNPSFAAATVLAKTLVSAFTFFMKGNKDDQLGVVEQSFIRALHYPNGSRKGVGVQDLSGNMWYDYFIYAED